MLKCIIYGPVLFPAKWGESLIRTKPLTMLLIYGGRGENTNKTSQHFRAPKQSFIIHNYFIQDVYYSGRQ